MSTATFSDSPGKSRSQYQQWMDDWRILLRVANVRKSYIVARRLLLIGAAVITLAANGSLSAQTLALCPTTWMPTPAVPPARTLVPACRPYCRLSAESLNGHAQPIDVLALEELYGNPSITLSYFVSQLDAIYPGSNYVYDTTSDPTTGNFTTGNGPSGLIYNANTVQDLARSPSVRQVPAGRHLAPMRYELALVGTSSAADFYMYVSHAKSGTTSSDADRRNVEAGEVRAGRGNSSRMPTSSTPAIGTLIAAARLPIRH